MRRRDWPHCRNRWAVVIRLVLRAGIVVPALSGITIALNPSTLALRHSWRLEIKYRAGEHLRPADRQDEQRPIGFMAAVTIRFGRREDEHAEASIALV